MRSKFVYIAVAGGAAALLAYLVFEAKGAAGGIDDGITPSVGTNTTGTVTGGDPVIVSGTFGYALPAAIPTLRR